MRPKQQTKVNARLRVPQLRLEYYLPGPFGKEVIVLDMLLLLSATPATRSPFGSALIGRPSAGVALVGLEYFVF